MRLPKTKRWMVATGMLAVMFNSSQAENHFEKLATGDFDGDGRQDVVIVDRYSGKCRLGYQTGDGNIKWVDFRTNGLPDVASVSAGRVLSKDKDALVMATADAASAEGYQIVVVNVSDPVKAMAAEGLAFAKLGPGVALAMRGAAYGTGLVYVGCQYESPPRGFLLRNDGKDVRVIAEEELPGEPVRGMRVNLGDEHTELAALVLKGNDKNMVRLDDVSRGKIEPIAAADVPEDSPFVYGRFGLGSLGELIFYRTNETTMTCVPLVKGGQGKVEFGMVKRVNLKKNIRFLCAINDAQGAMLVVSLDEGDTAEICTFNGINELKPILTLTNRSPKEVFCGAVAVGNRCLVLSSPRYAKPMYSTRYQWLDFEGGNPVVKTYGSLPTIEESDEWTIVDIHRKVVAGPQFAGESAMARYTNSVPGSNARYVMVPIPGGEFAMGSPAAEPGRNPDEGPLHKVRVEPFWMGAFEVTWNEYEVFMSTNLERMLRTQYPTDTYVNKLSDAITRPSEPFADMTFDMGRNGYPAISMTQHAANKYCQWLSARTGHFYRLPTEAEWEYAARAGSTNAYFFGDDSKDLVQYAWFGRNSDWKYQKVGKKKPNPWGVYDIYGNVVEWVLDQYEPQYPVERLGQVMHNPWNKATKPYPHVVRGGCWDDDDSGRCRSAARRGSDPSWKMQDPQLPKSKWYFTDARWVGFRIVRPLKVPSPAEMKACWISGVEKE